MSLAILIATAVAAAAKAFSAGGIDGIAAVRAWPGGWHASTHQKHIAEALAQNKIGPTRFVEIPVGTRLKVAVMADALAIGGNPPCRIPVCESECQRLADRIGKKLGRRLLLPTPQISDAVHLHAVRGNGRALDVVNIWNDPTEPKPAKHLGQNVPQWLRQQERIRKAIAAAGGYPSTGVVSTVGKDVVLAPQVTDVAKPGHVGGEGTGPKMLIYGWHTKQKPAVPPPPPLQNPGPWAPHDPKDLTAAGWPGVQQGESARHTDQDGPNGGFWDYSSTVRLVLDDCTLDGKPASLAAVYLTLPELVYVFPAGAPKRAIPSRYPMVPVSVA